MCVCMYVSNVCLYVCIYYVGLFVNDVIPTNWPGLMNTALKYAENWMIFVMTHLYPGQQRTAVAALNRKLQKCINSIVLYYVAITILTY
jgi:hypothetical protein